MQIKGCFLENLVIFDNNLFILAFVLKYTCVHIHLIRYLVDRYLLLRLYQLGIMLSLSIINVKKFKLPTNQNITCLYAFYNTFFFYLTGGVTEMHRINLE